jgi:hypothetical protein
MSVSRSSNAAQLAVSDTDRPLEDLFEGPAAEFGGLLDKAGAPRSLRSGKLVGNTVFVPTSVAFEKLAKQRKLGTGHADEFSEDQANALAMAHVSAEEVVLSMLTQLVEGGEPVQIDTMQGNPLAIGVEIDPKTEEERYTIRDGRGKASHILAYTSVNEGPSSRHFYLIDHVIVPTSANMQAP